MRNLLRLLTPVFPYQKRAFVLRVPDPVRPAGGWVQPRGDDLAPAHINHRHAARTAHAGVERGVDVVAVVGDHRQVAERSSPADLAPCRGG